MPCRGAEDRLSVRTAPYRADEPRQQWTFSEPLLVNRALPDECLEVARGWRLGRAGGVRAYVIDTARAAGGTWTIKHPC